MLKRGFFLIFFIFSVYLYALNDSQALTKATYNLYQKDKTSQFRAYNEFKNLYLRALLRGDEILKYKSLEGIVKSGNKLHVDVRQYANEFASMKKKHKAYIKKKVVKKSSKVKITSSTQLKSIYWRDGGLVVEFNKKLRNNQINYFSFYDSKHRKYKYIFEINSVMFSRSSNLSKKGIDKIQVVQYKPNIIRLIIQNSTKLSIRFKKMGNAIFIRMINKGYKKKKTSYKQHSKIYKPHKQKTIYRYKKTIVIDPGHGGKDPGAIGYRGYKEKNVVLSIARELRKILQSRGYRVYMTRDRDVFIKLRNRTKFANKKDADLFISIHANAVGHLRASKASGLECWFLSTSKSDRAKKVAAIENSVDMSEMDFYGKNMILATLNSHKIIASNKLAIDLQRGALWVLHKKFKDVKDAGVRDGPFWVLVGAQMPAVLVEVGFITNKKEAKRLVNREYQKSMALGLANGVDSYFSNN